jgi:hypothetical protein
MKNYYEKKWMLWKDNEEPNVVKEEEKRRQKDWDWVSVLFFFHLKKPTTTMSCIDVTVRFWSFCSFTVLNNKARQKNGIG